MSDSGIIPTQDLNLGLLHCTQIPYYLSHQEKPLEFCIISDIHNNY